MISKQTEYVGYADPTQPYSKKPKMTVVYAGWMRRMRSLGLMVVLQVAQT